MNKDNITEGIIGYDLDIGKLVRLGKDGKVYPVTKKKRKQPWRIEEGKVAKQLGGRRQPRSGGIPGMKSDIKTAIEQVEHKYTDRKSFSITLDILKKIDREALQAGKTPALVITFSQMERGCPRSWILKPLGGELDKLRPLMV